ncbi:MAG: DUF1080 domain-containing protein [Ginsengibacter sp.]
MKTNLIQTAVSLFLMLGCISCDAVSSEKDPKKDSVSSEKSSKTKEGFISLFNGENLEGWHGFNKTEEVENWKVEDGAMVCLGAAADASGGDLVSDQEFENFELIWEWKVTKGGNSGVMYHVVESSKYHAPYETGPEYQMIDDIGFPEKLDETQKSGADYAMYATNEKKKLMPVGEWNSSKIIFDNGHVEHWLNGEKVLEFEAWEDDWKKRKEEGKWKSFPDYGKAKKGRIALQDHGNKVYFKDIYIKELNKN